MTTSVNYPSVGISGIALHMPPYRVCLEDWCRWNEQDWNKVRNVIGASFRMLGPQQSVYTMAANAVLRLIERYDIDPQNVGFLGLGTESSTDNSAGAIIVKGIVDDALIARGVPEEARLMAEKRMIDINKAWEKLQGKAG